MIYEIEVGDEVVEMDIPDYIHEKLQEDWLDNLHLFPSYEDYMLDFILCGAISVCAEHGIDLSSL